MLGSCNQSVLGLGSEQDCEVHVVQWHTGMYMGVHGYIYGCMWYNGIWVYMSIYMAVYGYIYEYRHAVQRHLGVYVYIKGAGMVCQARIVCPGVQKASILLDCVKAWQKL